MKEKFPKKEKSKGFSKHESWEGGSELTRFVIFPGFIIKDLLADVFGF